jgi:hypothetical protein
MQQPGFAGRWLMPPPGGFPISGKTADGFRMPRGKEYEMKKNCGLSIFCAALLSGALFIFPVSAEMKKIDEAELARTNASITGPAVKDRTFSAHRGANRAGTEQAIVTSDKATSLSPLSANKAMEGVSLNLNISGQETWQFNFGSYNTNYYGGISGVRTR